MYLDVVWTNRASTQFQSLTMAEQANVQRVIETLRTNPDVGRYDLYTPTPEQRTANRLRRLRLAGQGAVHLSGHLSAQAGASN